MTYRSMPLLLVEDDEDDVALLRRACRRAGLANPVVVLGDGDAAVDYLGGTGPYADRGRHPLPMLVLLDLKLPRRSGHEVLAWLRAQAGPIRRLPVVVLTSSARPEDVNRAYEAGANTYLVKPGSAEALLDIVRTIDRYWVELSAKPETGSP
jgi:CheY-like chemotaxis protein